MEPNISGLFFIGIDHIFALGAFQVPLKPLQLELLFQIANIKYLNCLMLTTWKCTTPCIWTGIWITRVVPWVYYLLMQEAIPSMRVPDNVRLMR